MAVSHVKSNTVPDFTGTITGFNSQGSTVTMTATGGGGDMTVDSTAFSAGQNFTVTSFTLNAGNA